MKEDFDLLAYLWRTGGIALIGSFCGHSLVYNGDLKPSDDLWLWLTLATGMIYFIASVIIELRR